MFSAAIRTVFARPDAEHVRDQLNVIATVIGRQFPRVAAMLPEAADTITAFADFPSRNGRRSGRPMPSRR